MNRENLYVFTSDILGAVAFWAVKQSPYSVPDNLDTVLRSLSKTFDERFDQFDMASFADRHELEQYVSSRLRSIPEYLAWNERKNGNQSPFSFSSRYDKPEPDNDFIDLDALERNVSMLIEREAAR